MAGANGDIAYGQVYTGTPVKPDFSRPRTKTCFNMYRMVPETLTMQDGDDNYTAQDGSSNSQRQGDLYHE